MTRRHVWIYGVLAGMAMTVMSACGMIADAVNDQPQTTQEPEEHSDPSDTAEPETTENPAETEPRITFSTGSLTQEEEAVILDNMLIMVQNLEASEYIGEGISMISSPEWFDSMAVRLYEGVRSYVLQKGDEILLTVQVGNDLSGKPFTAVFFPGADDMVIILRQEGDVTLLLKTAIDEKGLYEGAFERWQIDSAAGEIRLEEGTYSEGIIVGEYSVSTCSVEPGAAFDLWTHREDFAYETTTVEYDENGEPVATPTPEPTQTPTPAPTKKPTATQKPATPAPTQNPTPAPQAPSTPEPAPEPTPAPTPEPPQDPTPGDVDVGWSDDLM